MAAAKTKPAPVTPIPTQPRRRLIHDADMLGDHDSCADFRLEGASVATMLVRSISPWEGFAVVSGGLDLAADELSVLVHAMQATDVNEEQVAHVLAGIENRLRVLREVARRVSEAQREEVQNGAA